MASLIGLTKIEISTTEYTKLVRESEQNYTIRRLLQKNKYVSIEDLKAILCIEDEEAPKEENTEKQYTFKELLGEKEGEE